MQPFEEFCGIESLYASWRRFKPGKLWRKDVLFFERHLEDELLSLSEDLSKGQYIHGGYHKFYVRDPKYRVIHKAMVRDCIVHQALHCAIEPLFEKKFFFDSYSARAKKGITRGIARLFAFARKASRNDIRAIWILHGDIEDFFGSVDHEALLSKLANALENEKYLNLCEMVIRSHNSASQKGLPLGNLTSQLFANIYLHGLDYFVKQKLRVAFYIRYNDDFFIVAENREELNLIAAAVQKFAREELVIRIPENKIKIQSLSSGADVLGSVIFPWGMIPRARLSRAVNKNARCMRTEGYADYGWRSAVSYLGLLDRTKSYFLRENLRLSCLL